MLIDVISDVIGAKINNIDINISYFNDICLEVDKIKRGDLFVALDNKDIKNAIKWGAYGIVYQGFLSKMDNETVYFQVDNINQSIHKLIKYLLVTLKKELYLTSYTRYNILKNISNDKKIAFITDDYINTIKKIKNKKATILISYNETFANAISKEPQTIDTKSTTIISSTMFKSSFSYKKLYFDNYKIAPHYIDDFISSIDFLNRYNILFNIDTNPCSSIFEPIRITDDYKITKQYNFKKTLIIQKNSQAFLKDVDYLNNNAKWANIIYCLPIKFHKHHKVLKNSLFFNKKSEIIDMIREYDFDFCYILGVKNRDLKLEKKEDIKDISLFGSYNY